MTDLQAYLIALTGLIVAIITVLTGNTRAYSWLIRLVITLFIIQIGFYGIRILSLPFPRNKLLAQILHSSYIISYSFYAGCFAGYFASVLFFKEKLKVSDPLLFQNVPVLYLLLRFSAAGVYFYSSLHSPFFYHQDLQFFTMSGYSAAFFIFISIVEFAGAIGLLFRKTALYGALLLMCDMIGAIYTHYHNYFTKHLPDPLGNSIPSLITQTVLITIIIFTLNSNNKVS